MNLQSCVTVPDSIIVLYDLGLTASQKNVFENWNDTDLEIIFREFPFQNYSPSMLVLKQYRFKTQVVKVSLYANHSDSNLY